MSSDSNQNDEKLRYKLIVQFLALLHGQNRQLDPHIQAIRQQLKQGARFSELRSDISSLSKTIDHLLKQKDQSHLVQTTSTGSLKIRFIKRLKRLLAGIHVPIKFQRLNNVLRQKLNKTLDDDALDHVLDSTVALILDINHHVLNEQKETEQFLESISIQLSQLDQQSKIANQNNLVSLSDRESWNADIHNQIDNIKHSTSNALELSSLQKSITLQLQELTVKLHKYKEGEDHRLHETQKQLTEMSKKLQDLEEEASSLRNNLKLAHTQAYHDSLTGLPNRLAYNEKIDMECKLWKRYQKPTALLVWDIDHFKRINDVYGHKAGDKALVLVGQLMKNNCRETDFIARYGGEEFVMLLHNISAEQSLEIAEKIRCAIANTEFNYHRENVKITLSCGISEFKEGDTRYEVVFERADRALYQSKSNGRNCCTVYR